MKYLIPLWIVWATALQATAQEEGAPPKETPVARQLNKGVNNARFLAEEWYASVPPAPRGVAGSPYLDESWQKARLLTEEGLLLEVLARYRIYDDQMQIFHDGQEKALYPAKVKAISLADRIFISTSYLDKNKREQLGYFELLVDGGAKLYLRREQIVRKSDYNPGLQVGDREDQLEIRTTYFYCQSGCHVLEPLKPTKRAVLSALSDKKSALSAYAAKHRLSLKKQADLVALFQYYNQISTP